MRTSTIKQKTHNRIGTKIRNQDRKKYKFIRYWGRGVDVIDMKNTVHFFSLYEYNKLNAAGRIIDPDLDK